MRNDRMPMLVLFSQTGCSYCEKARAHFIAPMATEPPWRDRALYRQIDLDSDDALIGFDGSPQTHRSFAKSAGVFVTPTVMVFGPDGAALAEPLVGVTLPDFYGQYLEQAIDMARKKLTAH